MKPGHAVQTAVDQVRPEAHEQLERVLANHRERAGREATVAELRRWAQVYRTIADALDALAAMRAAVPVFEVDAATEGGSQEQVPSKRGKRKRRKKLKEAEPC